MSKVVEVRGWVLIWLGSAGIFLHPLSSLNSEHGQSLFEDAAGQIAEGEAVGSVLRFGFENGAAFPEAGEQAGEIVEVIAEEIGAVIRNDRFQHEAEIEEMLREGKFIGCVEGENRLAFFDRRFFSLAEDAAD